MSSTQYDEAWLLERGYRIEGDRAVRIAQAPSAWEDDAAMARHAASAAGATQAPPAAWYADSATGGNPATVQPKAAQQRSCAPYRSFTEQRYAEHLVTQHLGGQCQDWWHEPIRLWLRPGMSYTPDFLVQTDGPSILSFTPGMPVSLTPAFVAEFCDYWRSYSLILYEVKAGTGHVYEASRAYDRLKIAAHLYPALTFRVAQWNRNARNWQQRDIPAN